LVIEALLKNQGELLITSLPNSLKTIHFGLNILKFTLDLPYLIRMNAAMS